MKKLLSLVTAIAVALALLTGAVAVPTLVRPIYYAHITALDLPEKSGMTQEEIIDAYDEVLDYCTGVTDEFSAGILPFSAGAQTISRTAASCFCSTTGFLRHQWRCLRRS